MRINDEMLQELGNKGHKTVYVFEHYRDERGYGHEEYYTDQEDAIMAAQDEWDTLNDIDKKSFLGSKVAYFRAASAKLFYEPCAGEWQVHADRQEILWSCDKDGE